jgi:hypothetical protein
MNGHDAASVLLVAAALGWPVSEVEKLSAATVRRMAARLR